MSVLQYVAEAAGYGLAGLMAGMVVRPFITGERGWWHR